MILDAQKNTHHHVICLFVMALTTHHGLHSAEENKAKILYKMPDQATLEQCLQKNRSTREDNARIKGKLIPGIKCTFSK